MHEFDRYGDVCLALADPFLVPVPADSGPPGSMAWLRATVARFSSDATHARRRALVEADLARLDPAALRRAVASGAADTPRRLVVRTLAEGLGLSAADEVADAVTIVAGAYFGDDAPEADAAVAWLLPRMLPAESADLAGSAALLDPGADRARTAEVTDARLEAAANRIGLLVQACDATGRLIEHARRPADRPSAVPSVEALLIETLRHDPPVRAMRRVATRDTCVTGVEITEGDLVILDIAAANRDPQVFANPRTFDPERTGPPPLTFGVRPRLCPGRDHALALAAGVLDRASADDIPATDDRDPAEAVTAMVGHVLALADTWTAWDGDPFPIDDRIYTPHKAIRRVADHLLDHLAELEARVAGEKTQPDRWHASAITTKADLAPFTRDDLDEAHSRLTRLAGIWANRLGALTAEQLDCSPGDGWTFRQIAFHLAESAYYADAIGDLTPTEDGHTS
ncbi:hypothetical protein GCM10010193_08400 [Kitasatospora atroaurantiaca]